MSLDMMVSPFLIGCGNRPTPTAVKLEPPAMNQDLEAEREQGEEATRIQ